MMAGEIDRGRRSCGAGGSRLRCDATQQRRWRAVRAKGWAAACVATVLAAGLVVPVSAGPAAAQTLPPASVDYDVDDDGLIEVSSLAQLNAIRWDLNGDGSADVYPPGRWGHTGHDPDGAAKLAAAFPGAVSAMGCPSSGCVGYELAADLDFDTNENGQADAGDEFWNGGRGWYPLMGGEAVRDWDALHLFEDSIGNSYAGDRAHAFSRMFTATFEGNGRTIANLYINDRARWYVGLFGYIGPGGHVRNVGLSAPNPDSIVRGHDEVGALAGSVERARVSGVWSDVDVTGIRSVGGLVGSNWRYGFVIESYATGNVHGESHVGGLAGTLNWSGIAASYAVGDVSASKGSAGGLAGQWSDGRIRATYATGSVTLEGALRLNRSNGQVLSRGGGLVGVALFCGGLGDWPRLRSSYSVGQVSRPQGWRNEGLTGGCTVPVRRADKGRAANSSYWDTDTSGPTDSPAALGAGYTTAQLQAPTSYAGIYADWNVDVSVGAYDGRFNGPGDDPWDFGTSSQYPVLKYCADKPGIDTADGLAYCPLDPDTQRSSGTIPIEVVPDNDDADAEDDADDVPAQDDAVPVVVPEISVAAGGDVTEGSGAVFTISASPPPTAGLDVAVTVSSQGDWGGAAGPQTVTLAAGSATATLTVPTSDDSTDEAAGSVSVSLDAPSADAGYTISAAQGTASVAVADDDVDPLTVYMIFFSTSVAENGTGYHNQAGLSIGVSRTLRSWETLTVPLSVTGGDEGVQWTMRDLNDPDAVFANDFEVTFGPGDQRVDLALTAVADSDWADHEITVSYGTASRAPTLNGSTDGVTLGISWGTDGTQRADGSTTVVIIDSDDPPPQVDITAAAGGTEGTAAVFTVTASKPAAADLDVKVTVSASGDWGAAAGTQTVTIAQGATQATLTVATVDDGVDEPDGSITATLAAGSGYEIGPQPTQTSQILDDDEPPPVRAVEACAGAPTVDVADATAQRGDDLEFVISLSCRSTRAVTIYYMVSHGPNIATSDIVTINSGDTHLTARVPTAGVDTSVKFHIVYTFGAANYEAQASGTITD
ncbi:hypothetical protein [Candidatus Poriferisodalis sp.]|uniref:hypothetical protein n=1 Tax=Candidatus Poriferisodalis sp. TaxID=3101277 RepID=UPI003B02A2A9